MYNADPEDLRKMYKEWYGLDPPQNMSSLKLIHDLNLQNDVSFSEGLDELDRYIASLEKDES
jgi:hypothetical protein